MTRGLLLCLGCCGWSHAATLTVGSAQSGCSNATYTTIGAALSAAQSGDEIDVCPGQYSEQLVITKPVILRGLGANGIQRVLVRPATMTATVPGAQAVISVVNTKGVVIQGLAIDASQNTVSGCTVTLAAIHFSNSSGDIANNAIFGAQLPTPLSCTKLFPGNGFGVLVDTTAGQTGPFNVGISGNSIHDFNRDGVLINGTGITAEIDRNTISGVGPSTGYNQFGVFIAVGAVGHVSNNTISQGNCGAIDVNTCITQRSEGIVFRAVGDNSVASANVITNAQSGIFLNGANQARIVDNIIMNIDALDGIDIQGSASGYFSNSLIAGNTISHIFPISSTASTNETGCGINEATGTGVAGNAIWNNTINDAYCGVAVVAADMVYSSRYMNVLYEVVNADQSPYPPAVEP